MKITVTPEIVAALKADLRDALPTVGSSHRTEAAACGLGWATNAAMRAALTGSPVDREPSPDDFSDYLSGHGFPVNPGEFSRAVLRVQIRAIQAAHPQLTDNGIGPFDSRRLSVDEWRAATEEGRASMLDGNSVFEFERACGYLSQLATTKTVNCKFGSYGLKHSAERFHHKGGDRTRDTYVANGMLIAAAYHLGLRVARVAPDSPNAHLNVSTRSVKEVGDDKVKVPQPDPGQHFRVLGHNHGLFFYSRGRSAKVLTLRATAHTPAQLKRLAPLDHWMGLFPSKDGRSPFDTIAAVDSLFTAARDAGIYEPPR